MVHSRHRSSSWLDVFISKNSRGVQRRRSALDAAHVYVAKEHPVLQGVKKLLEDEAIDMDESEMSEVDANAVTLIGVPDEDIEIRHDGFDTVALEVISQARAFDSELGQKAYQLLLEMHALGAPLPVHVQLPSLTWELKSQEAVFSVSVMIMAHQWDFLLNGATANGRHLTEEGHHRGSPREFVEHVFRVFTLNGDFATEQEC